ncbi:MAG TPA: T9SS type A sorting domain-containing protein [Bacteroidales bacterium]|nr:T9SS type A sorting domain-containing protein [Bacteroidales bacterium]HPF02332.1 T9SS type A sorting domain-containing protein [Bacteroidales bacterium]HPJ58177.1 T9SS type A sorting domain-containing protein [Bacteroidales bacterium]HPR11508.1 T9SS type A sorting domain-containing protein [Bacteroidales bacterium]HRW84250.1 T9SS type A sorting domain-containing protein [Bacteroidales bacterium]
MKQSLIFILLVIFSSAIQAQKDTVIMIPVQTPKNAVADAAAISSISIYPNPVRESYFNISSKADISSVKVTNIIGQDIFKEKFSTPESPLRIILNNPKRGMYLVTIILGDGTRVVKKIMIEQSE